ncbi:MAG: glycosyl transferase family protein [Xanthobacteraceae bacterium]|jgi:hypothetical protein|nr:glycosyl transferase family protein [Xanthobacteraceae bacterium]
MKVLVDGIAFQFDRGSARHFWQPVLNGLGLRDGVELLVLDRGDTPPEPSFNLIGFPSYTAAYTPADSQLIERVAQHYRADVFFSTGCSTPIETPSIAIVGERIFDPAAFATRREWSETRLLLRHASRFLCLSETARGQLQQELGWRLDVRQIRIVAVGVGNPSYAEPAENVFGDVVSALADLLSEAASVQSTREDQIFYEKWAALRKIQYDVDG